MKARVLHGLGDREREISLGAHMAIASVSSASEAKSSHCVVTKRLAALRTSLRSLRAR